MMRVVALSILGTVLTACSGSGRVATVVPGWANTPPRVEAPQTQNEVHSLTQNEAQRSHSEARSKPDIEPQDAKKPEVRSLAEE